LIDCAKFQYIVLDIDFIQGNREVEIVDFTEFNQRVFALKHIISNIAVTDRKSVGLVGLLHLRLPAGTASSHIRALHLLDRDE
jgi:hypothetical protein